MDEPVTDPPAPHQAPPARAPIGVLRWMRQGLRSSLFLPLRLPAPAPTPLQLLVIFAAVTLVGLALQRLQIRGPAHFDPQPAVATWWSWPLTLWLVWWATSARERLASAPGTPQEAAWRGAPVAAWTALALAAVLPPLVVMHGLGLLQLHGFADFESSRGRGFFWTVFIATLLWTWAVQVALLRRLGGTAARVAWAAVALAGLLAFDVWRPVDNPWTAVPDPAAASAAAPERMRLSQETFEAQQALWPGLLQGIAAQRPGVVDVYGLVFAPYADDVFLREGDMVADVLRTRFDAAGRVLRLQNHVKTVALHPWATPPNLRRAVAALAERMDRDEDVLVVYMTSHGGQDFHLAASHGPLQVDAMTAQALRAALDEAGVRWRVVAVSACYSGGWVDPLAGPGTLVMTAADATHTSYGCGYKSPLTFFGRAVFDEQLRTTYSFRQAFAQAVPVIAQREIEGGKDDGFSNPQLREGGEVARVLDRLVQQLARR